MLMLIMCYRAVMDVDWSPDGRGLVSGSYDRTLRLQVFHHIANGDSC